MRPAPVALMTLACAVGACGNAPPPTGAQGPWTLARAPSDAVADPLCEGSPAHDDDHDGVADGCEDDLAQRFAPIVIHSTDESNFPTNVDAFLRETSLAFHDDACPEARNILVERAPTEGDLSRHSLDSPCGGARVASGGSRSLGKHRTFFLMDVPGEERRGSEDTRQWTTYVHAYPNDLGGVTLQYWRFYAYNDALNDHGGDWEGIHVALDAHESVARVRLLQHSHMVDLSPRQLGWAGSHVVIYSEGGGHASRASGIGIVARNCDFDPCVVSLADRATYVSQETWRGGRVSWPDGTMTEGGGLVNMGEKSAPLNGQTFVRYSGLWGSPGLFFGTSGYWGPTYNETDMRADGFIASWCAGMGGALDRKRECWPMDAEP